jgi:hypothetical protein
MGISQSAYPPLRNLEGVIAKLEPLSNQPGLVKFLRGVDNAKTLTGFVQELADSIMDYRVRVADPTVSFAERSASFRYNKECTRRRGKPIMIPRTS